MLRTTSTATFVTLSGCVDGLDSLESDSFKQGTVLWKITLDGTASGPIRNSDSTLYVAVSAGGTGDHQLYALARADSSKRWALQLGSGATGVAHGDRQLYTGTSAGDIIAVRPESGDIAWKQGGTQKISSALTVSDGRVLVGDVDRRIRAHDAETGRTLWTARINQSVRGAPRVLGNQVLVGGRNLLYAFDSADGTRNWSTLVAGSVIAPVATGDEWAAVCAGNSVHRVDTETGERNWRFDTDLPIRRAPAIADDTVYVGSDDGHLYAIDSTAGEARWRVQLGDKLTTRPVVANGRIYVGSASGALSAVDASNGNPVWRVELGDGLGPVSATATGTVYVGDWTGNLYAVTGPS
jgi:outer membrane protein assembly factor BamB